MTSVPETQVATKCAVKDETWEKIHRLLAIFNKRNLNILYDVQNGNNEAFTSLTAGQKAGVRVVFREAHINALRMVSLRTQILALVDETDKSHWTDTDAKEEEWAKHIEIDNDKSGGEEFSPKCVWAMMVLRVKIRDLVKVWARCEDEGVELGEALQRWVGSAKGFVDAIVSALPPDCLPKMEYV
jgi:hypothetical protein